MIDGNSKANACYEASVPEAISDRRGENVESSAADRRLRAENMRLRRLLDLQDRDRQLIGYEIHDGLAQDLAGALMQFQAFQSGKGSSHPLDWNAFLSGVDRLRESIHETRQLVAGLRPIGTEGDLPAALRELAHRTAADGRIDIEMEFEADIERLSDALKNTIFRIVQEGLANMRRHSQSDRMRISLHRSNGEVRLRIQDWGIGFAPDKVGEGHYGLEGILRRAELFGGRAEISSAPGAGTRIDVMLPE